MMQRILHAVSRADRRPGLRNQHLSQGVSAKLRSLQHEGAKTQNNDVPDSGWCLGRTRLQHCLWLKVTSRVQFESRSGLSTLRVTSTENLFRV